MNKNKDIIFYKTDCGKLIQYNKQTNVYKIRNTIERIDSRVSVDDFEKMKSTQIKRELFSKLMNEYFSNVEHQWEYNGKKFKKINNFKSNGVTLSENYVLGKDIPLHKINDYEKYILVYHWGKVYYHNITYGGYKSGCLICTKTGKMVRWAQLRHCAPILCIDNNKIC